MTDSPHLLIVEGRFYDDIMDTLVEGAVAALDRAGATYERLPVPGAFEVPNAVRMAVRSLDFFAGRKRFDGYIALGCVIRGETSHYEIVANESARALLSLATQGGVPVANGILTVENRSQAWERAATAKGNKGAGAAQACLRLINVFMDCHGFRSE